jgi:hypothetical protein
MSPPFWPASREILHSSSVIQLTPYSGVWIDTGWEWQDPARLLRWFPTTAPNRWQSWHANTHEYGPKLQHGSNNAGFGERPVPSDELFSQTKVLGRITAYHV